MALNELELVEWLRKQQPVHAGVELGIGDDMAVLRTACDSPDLGRTGNADQSPELKRRVERPRVGPRGSNEPHSVVHRGLVLLSSDMLLDGIHFDTARHKPEQIGRKAIACSLSDCAAMAVRPLAATVSVALPDPVQADATPINEFNVKALFNGIFGIAAEYDLAIVGGDTTRWPHPLAIDVAITATPFSGIEPVTRSGAMLADTLYVTGPLGGSLRGAHMTFTPRVDEARCIAETLGLHLHAMIDISDGLSLDLWRMCQASGVGATLDEADLQSVISEDARLLAEDPQHGARSALDHVLADGEDFELLLAVSGETKVPGVPLHRVGTVTDSGLFIRRVDGSAEPLAPRGFVH